MNLAAAVRAWWARRSDAFRRSVVTAGWSFVGAISVPTLRLLDDLGAWAEGTTGAPSFVTFGRTVVAAAIASVAGIANYLFRRARPAPGSPDAKP